MEKEAPKRKVPRKATRRYLENAAEYYLQRFSTSTANFRRVMMQKVRLSARHHDTDPEEGAAVIEDLVQRFQRVGVLDDTRYAELRAGSIHRRGGSKRSITAKLKEKGLSEGDIENAYEALKEDHEDPELEAAITFAKRRRLGPYRTGAAKENQQEKDLAAIARAGFSYSMAVRVLGPEDERVEFES
jgi:regulatory protein